MKIFFASLDNLEIEVDAWVATKEQGVILLQSLRRYHHLHNVVMRARMQRYQNYEERFIGGADTSEAVQFINRVKEMGNETLPRT